MILSNRAIQEALDEKRLVIDPEPKPRRPSMENPDCPYGTTSVDLRLAPKISIPKSGAFAFDLKSGKIAEFLAQRCDDIDLATSGPYTLDRGAFILGQTMENVELPLVTGKPTLAARIEGKSSCARCGILVHFTAPTVHAGWAGKLTLEITNLGPGPFVLRPNEPICQLILEQVEGEPFESPSQFQGQTTPPGTH
jgi:dCTP deaminase